MTKQKVAVLAGVLALAAAGVAALILLQPGKPVSRSDFLMDTLMEQSLSGREAQQASDRIAQTLRELDARLDRYDPDSEIAAVNAAAGREGVAVSADTYALLKRAVELAEQTGGVFDPTIGPVTALWHDAKEAGVPPQEAEIARCLDLVDYRDIRFDDDAQTVMLAREGMSLDLGGIAKGYASDLVKEICEEADIDAALVSLGGNVYCHGVSAAGKQGHRIGIRDPQAEDGSPLLALTLTDQVLATSAAYERYFEYEGTTYHHIIDPATGFPADSDLLSVTVISPDGTLADCLSTTLYIEGMTAVEEIISRQEAGEALSFSLVAIDRTGTVYLSPALRDTVVLFEDKESQYHLA